MSNCGLVMIAVWGLACWSAVTIGTNIRWLMGAFAIEKLVYVVVWVIWLSNNSLSTLYSRDVLAGIFYSIDGMNDFVFMLFFSSAFVSQRLKADA
jgi:hypothetical protein